MVFIIRENMVDWGNLAVVVPIIVGFISIIKPIISLTNAIAELNSSVKKLSQDLDETIQNNIESHRRIWAHNDEQDRTLNDLDKRVAVLEDRT